MTLEGHGAPVMSAVFSPDGITVATASSDKSARLWRISDGKGILTLKLKGHKALVWSVAFSQDGVLLFTASADRTSKLWLAETGECLRTFSGHTAPVKSAVFSMGTFLPPLLGKQPVALGDREAIRHEHERHWAPVAVAVAN